MNPKVLIVEDEKDISGLMALHLKREGLDSETAEDGEEALRLLTGKKYELVVLDWMLPGISGLELCKKLRAEKMSSSSVPILMVTARAQTEDIVRGLEVGADDYVTKPFELPVLMARVRALLRRRALVESGQQEQIQVGALNVDLAAHSVTCHGQEAALTVSEFKLLVALVKNRGRVLTRERLIDLVQGEGVTVVDRAIDTHVFGLRKKLGDCAALIETIRGVGYRVNDTV